jgi:hypothetical protein
MEVDLPLVVAMLILTGLTLLLSWGLARLATREIKTGRGTKMKKFFKTVFILAAIVALFGLAIWAGTGFAEGTKSMTAKMPPVTVAVPEQAPEFLNWDAQLTGMEEFPNGNALLLVQYVNPSETVIVVSLWGKRGETFSLLAFGVFYEVRPNAPAEIYEDLGFLKDGKVTGVLSRVDKPDSLDLFKAKLAVMGI